MHTNITNTKTVTYTEVLTDEGSTVYHRYGELDWWEMRTALDKVKMGAVWTSILEERYQEYLTDLKKGKS